MLRKNGSVVALTVIVAIGVFLVFVAGQQSAAATLSSKTRDVASQLRCPICQGESVFDSPSGLARDMRGVIHDQLAGGKSESQVKQYFVNRYGQWILLSPPSSGVGLIAWTAPAVLVILSLTLFGLAAMRWLRNRRMDGSTVSAIDAEELATERDLLAQQLEDGSISEKEYAVQSSRLERALTSARGSSKTVHRHTGRNIAALLAGAVVIAGTVSFAVQDRGTGPITGTIPDQVTNSTCSTAVAANQPKDVQTAECFALQHNRQASAWLKLGSVLLSHHEIANAKAAFLSSLSLKPGFVEPGLELAFIDIGQCRDTAATRLLRPIGRENPQLARYWLLKGIVQNQEPGGNATGTRDRGSDSCCLIPPGRPWSSKRDRPQVAGRRSECRVTAGHPFFWAFAFGAGVLSFTSPCCLPLVPGYLSFMSGVSLDDMPDRRQRLLIASLLFVAGFAFVFTMLGATASLLGSVVSEHRLFLIRLSGAFVIFMGLVTLGIFKFPMLLAETRFHMRPRLSMWGALPLGMAFAFGWTPCIGPVLASILTVAGTEGSVRKGAAFLFVYALGMGLPFIIAGVFLGQGLAAMAWLKKHYFALNVAAGTILCIMGFLLITNQWLYMLSPVMRWYSNLNWQVG